MEEEQEQWDKVMAAVDIIKNTGIRKRDSDLGININTDQKLINFLTKVPKYMHFKFSLLAMREIYRQIDPNHPTEYFCYRVYLYIYN